MDGPVVGRKEQTRAFSYVFNPGLPNRMLNGRSTDFESYPQCVSFSAAPGHTASISKKQSLFCSASRPAILVRQWAISRSGGRCEV
jgi:hypothetical protein